MSKFVPLLVLCLISGSVLGEEPQFKSERAKNAEAAYQAKLKEAREAYLKELEVAIKETGGAGDLEDANRIAEVKETLEQEGQFDDRDPLALVRKDLEGSAWKPSSNPRGRHHFLKNNKTINYQGIKGVWVVTDEKTAVTQVFESSDIYVFEFDKDRKTANVFRFVKSKDAPKFYRRQ